MAEQKDEDDQIKNMIQKMIFHLMAEQKDEDDHKNWCDKELETTAKMKADKETKRDTLQASIDVLTQEIADLGVKIKENQEAVALMQTEIEDETEERQAEKAENTATIKDAQDAQTAVSEAIAVLSDFYKGTGMVEKEDWEEFNQMSANVRRVKAAPGETKLPEPNPELFESPYKGSDQGAGVIGMLQEIAEDFALMETNAKADETEQQDEYDKWLTGTKISISEKEKDTETKEIEALKQAQDILEKAFDEPAEEGPTEEGPPA